MLLGILFTPGACIFNLLFSKNTIHKRLGVESFLIKITIYPILSLIYLGIITFSLASFGLTNSSIYFLFLICSCIILFFLFIYSQKIRGNKPKIQLIQIKISRNTSLILFMGVGIIIISIGIIQFHPYLITGDIWKSISPAFLIGTGKFQSCEIYAKYWGSLSYGLSIMFGIPAINSNVLLLPFLYLSITSIYLFTKSFLNHPNEKVCVLSAILIVMLLNPRRLVFRFGFNTFSLILLFLSLTLFFVVVKTKNFKYQDKKYREDIPILILSSLLIVQSFMTYFLFTLMAFIIIFLYSFFSTNFKYYLKNLLLFYGFFLLILFIIDLISGFFYSFYCFQFLTFFSNIPFNFRFIELYSLRIGLTALLFYTIFLSFFIVLFLLYKFSNHIAIYITKVNLLMKDKLKKSYKNLFRFLTILIFLCLFLASFDPTFGIRFLYDGGASPQNPFLIFYLSNLFGTIGFIGILGLFLSYFCFRENKNLFGFLFSLSIIIILLATSLIFLRWVEYPNQLVANIPENNMLYWFSRSWYFSMIPLSIFASIGIIKLTKKIKSSFWFKIQKLDRIKNKTHMDIKRIISVPLIAVIIFLSLSTSITNAFYWVNYFAVTHDEAQIMGWTSKNIPQDSQILMGPSLWSLKDRLERDLFLYKTYSFNSEMSDSISNYTLSEEDLYKWRINSSANGEVKLLYEYDGYRNVIFLEDLNELKDTMIFKEFIKPQTNGTLSFNLKMNYETNFVDPGLFLKILGDSFSEGIDLYLNYNNLYYYNDSSNQYESLEINYDVNGWNHYDIHFNSNLGSWNISINGLKLNNSRGNSQFKFIGAPINLTRIIISTENEGKNYAGYFSQFNFSWNENISEVNNYERILLNDITKFIYNLNSKDINYLIMSKNYIKLYQELIDYFYRLVLYDYGNLIIYKSIK